MAKSKAQPARAEVARRRHTTKADAERWSRIFLVGGVIAVVLIAVGVIAFGWYQTQIKPLGKTVLQVGNSKYSLGYLEHRMRLLRKQDPTYGDLAAPNTLLVLPDVTLALLEREAKLLEAAGSLNITATDEDVTAEIRSRGNLAADVQPSVYAAEFAKQVQDSGLSESQYVQMIRAYLLGQKVQNYFRFFAPESELQVRGQYILFGDATKADQGLQQLRAGAAFDQVAADLGITSSSSGGKALNQQDWTPRTDTPANPSKIQDYFFGVQPGQISDVLTVGSYFIVAQPLERDDNRALDDAGKQKVASREMEKWFDSQDAKLTIKKNLSTSDSTRALNDVLP
jgi:hypothetical protein